jgi:curved DNA-binding protein CbpA
MLKNPNNLNKLNSLKYNNIINNNNINNKSNLSNKIKLIKIQKRNLFRKVEIVKNNYQILGIPFDASYEEIKKAYYDLAKKYHPDINPSEESLEKFKEIKKAYEILGDPNMRISYDIENKFTNESASSRAESDNRYSQRYGKRVMKGPRTIKNFYFDKWSEFKIPKWSNLRSGYDYKSEYIFREKDEDMEFSYITNQRIKFLKKNRFFFYFVFLFSLDLYIFMDNLGLFLNYRLIKNTFFKDNNNNNDNNDNKNNNTNKNIKNTYHDLKKI